MSKSDLRKKAEIAPNTMTKLRRDEEVSLTILSKICKTLNADFGDIVEYVPDAEIWDLYDENRELLGKDHVRGEQLPIDGYHLVVHVWIRTSCTDRCEFLHQSVIGLRHLALIYR